MSTAEPSEPPPPEDPKPAAAKDGSAGEVSKDASVDAETTANSTENHAELERPYSVEEKALARQARGDAAYRTTAGVTHNVERSQAGRDTVHGNVQNNEITISAEALVKFRLPISGPVDDEYLNHLRLVHVESASFADLVDQLAKNSLLLLAGRAGTGRLHAALRALDEVTQQARGPSPIHLVSLGTSLDDALLSLQKGQAYVLDASGAEWAFRLDHAAIWRISQQVRERESQLTILVDEPWLLEADLPQLIRHLPPDQFKVTVSHLATDLLEADGVLSAARQFAHVDVWLRPGRGPAVAVSLAAAIALWHRSGLAADVDLAAYDLGPQPADLHRKFTLRQARSLLRQTTENREQEGWTPRSQSLVLASAVLDGRPLDSVIRAAEDLRHRLTQVEVPDQAVGSDVFEAPLKHWLRHADITDEYVPTAVLSSETSAWTTDPLVRLTDPMLATCILEAAWRDYDLLRAPLLNWLRGLCREGTATEHTLAAVAIGKLAAVDFGTIRDQVLDPWAGTGGIRAQQSVAWALEYVVLAGGAAGREAARLIDSWARSPGWRRWAALRALGTVSWLDPAKTFRRLAEAARTGPPRQDELIQDAMVDSYFSGLEQQVLVELHDWSLGSSIQRRRAASTFLELTVVPAVGSAPPVPDLLIRVAEGEQLARLGDLWLLALGEATTRRRGWRCLLQWAGSPGAREVFPALRKQLERSPEVVARLRLWDAVQQSRSAS